jgi:hypothetical protein
MWGRGLRVLFPLPPAGLLQLQQWWVLPAGLVCGLCFFLVPSSEGGGGLVFVAQGCNGFLVHNQRGGLYGTVLSLVSFEGNHLQQV